MTRSGVRVIHIPEWLRIEILAHRGRADARSTTPESPMLAARNGQPLRDSAVNAALRSMVAGTEFEGYRGLIQIGRRTAGTLIERSEGAAAAAATLGHSKIDVATKHYIAGRRERPDHSAALEGLGSGGSQKVAQPEPDSWD